MGMKMARASERDLDCAIKLASAIDDLERGHMPHDPERSDLDQYEGFDRHEGRDCAYALNRLLGIASQGSISRVVWGLCVLLDPKNNVVDPQCDHIDLHPRIKKALELLDAKEAANSEQVAEAGVSPSISISSAELKSLVEAAAASKRYFDQVVAESGLASDGEKILHQQCTEVIAKFEKVVAG